MQLTSEQRILVVINYLRNRSCKEVQQLFQQRFQDRISPTKMTIRKNVKSMKLKDQV